MRAEIRDALEAGAGVAYGSSTDIGLIKSARRQVSPERLRIQLVAVLQELPDTMTVAELRDELQAGGSDHET